MKTIILSFINVFVTIWIAAWFFHVGTPNPTTWIQWAAAFSGVATSIFGTCVEIVIFD